ncbi:MAG: site-specific DNA-methyltransferase [Pseudomonadota bacterium]
MPAGKSRIKRQPVLDRKRAPRNRTMLLTDHDRARFGKRLMVLDAPAQLSDILDRTICQDTPAALDLLPHRAFDLVFADPPYNLTKTFNGNTFNQSDLDQYQEWLDSWIMKLPRLLKNTASVYICGDWRSSAAIQRILLKYFKVRNRITWERDKGRGARKNWKNNSEDIWFATVSDDYVFNVDEVKLRRRVVAPYTEPDGQPKDWSHSEDGRFRSTHPSNIWTDLTVPFWSMPENTDHPTQKPEKLLAKIILAGSNVGDVVLDPFLGSGTTSVVAKKLGRHFIGMELERDYCCLAEKRLESAEINPTIQGYADGVFWERNTLAEQTGVKTRRDRAGTQWGLFSPEGADQR